jgi:hypothetical protein
MIRFLALTAIAITMVFLPGVARADIKEGDYEQQGWCFDRVDPVFDDALGGRHNPDAVVNERPHVHVGGYAPQSALLGRCVILWGVWTNDQQENKHLQAFIQKDEQGAVQYVSESEALQFSSVEATDNYFHRGDPEMAASTNCADVGSTKAGRGNSGGDCDK